MSKKIPNIPNWSATGTVPASKLLDARLQLHWASQVVASVGYTCLEHEADWSHVSLSWDHDFKALVGKLAPGSLAYRAALRFSDFTLLLLDKHGSIYSSRKLAGGTLDQAYGWIAHTIEDFTGGPLDQQLKRLDHELPTHPVCENASFSYTSPEAFIELGEWYANAELFLQLLKTTNPKASSVQCWPHHFDIAMLFPLEENDDSEEAKSIGIGMTPGDDYYAEPYWYVLPWPHPSAEDVPELKGSGFWHTEEWVGAVLPASKMRAGSEAQVADVWEFVCSGIEASRVLLEP